ncbi:MAG: hypothetical protein QM703_27880 [Gemmatales bacterium]
MNKAWAVILCIVCTLILLGTDTDVIMPITLLIGAVGYLEVLLILCIAKEPPIDVPTLWHLLQRQRSISPSQEAS